MNIFYIPTWYPHAARPHVGSYIQEQVEALASCYPEHRYIVSLHGQQVYRLSLRHGGNLNTLKQFWSATKQPQINYRGAHVVEILTPALEWSDRICDGNLAGWERAHDKNFQQARQHFGKIDLIHAHVCYPGGWLAMKLAQKYHLPYLITEHMGPFPLPKPRFMASDGSLTPWVLQPLQQANHVIAVSRALAAEIHRFGIPKVQVIPNMINETVFKPIPMSRLNRPFTFFTLAHLSPEKGIPELLAAIAQVVAVEPDVHFMIGGDSLWRKDYQLQMIQQGLGTHITWLGHIPRSQVPFYHNRADAFVLPSHHESFGLVYVEALACGKPVIATRCGGPEDFVTPENGFLVEKRDAQSLATSMLNMMHQYADFQSEVIRQQCLQSYSRMAVGAQLMAVYQSLLVPSETRGFRR